jgi:hypothetical protein
MTLVRDVLMTPPKFLLTPACQVGSACPWTFVHATKMPDNVHRAIIRNDQNNVPEACAPFWSGALVYHVLLKEKEIDLTFLNVLDGYMACPAAKSAIK